MDKEYLKILIDGGFTPEEIKEIYKSEALKTAENIKNKSDKTPENKPGDKTPENKPEDKTPENKSVDNMDKVLAAITKLTAEFHNFNINSGGQPEDDDTVEDVLKKFMGDM